jgi:hypothetical protein
MIKYFFKKFNMYICIYIYIIIIQIIIYIFKFFQFDLILLSKLQNIPSIVKIFVREIILFLLISKSHALLRRNKFNCLCT